jgi:hypothetical protein
MPRHILFGIPPTALEGCWAPTTGEPSILRYKPKEVDKLNEAVFGGESSGAQAWYQP